MSELTLFENMPDEYKSLLAQLQPDTNATGRQSGGMNRLSIRGGVFRKVVNGQEVGELEQRAIGAVLVKTAPVSRMYFEGQYVAGQTNPPKCWSADTKTGRPADDVLASDRQSETCFDCKQNIKGSGMGEGRACRFSQRVALLLADSEGKIKADQTYQLSLPATSVFGDNKQKMGLQTYARHLDGMRAPLAAVLTEIRFDTDSSTPKLCFKPIRMLEADELKMSVGKQKDEDTEKLIALSVKPKEDSTPVAIPKMPDLNVVAEPAQPKAVEVAAEVEEVEEPTIKVSKKKKPESPADVDLASLLDEFDD
jgi:hypothetical protein